MPFFKTARIAGAVSALIFATHAHAWGPDGHHSVGALADQLIAGSAAAAQVSTLLGGGSLQEAAVWADCAKGVDPAQGYAYTSAGRYPECKVYETPAGEAEMIDFVKRNDVNCDRKPTEESCHKQYHYADVAVQRDEYVPGLVGTRKDDVVAATAAAVAVLKGLPAPAPFNITSKREALRLLAHYVGDIHQPLHVAAVYLSAKGTRVDPDIAGLDEATETRGGNQILTLNATTKKKGANLHHIWDEVPATSTPSHVDAAWVSKAHAVAPTTGAVDGWPALWATETLAQGKRAFSGLKFARKQGVNWTVTLPTSYTSKTDPIKRAQLTAAGARLAQILQTIWP